MSGDQCNPILDSLVVPDQAAPEQCVFVFSILVRKEGYIKFIERKSPLAPLNSFCSGLLSCRAGLC